MINRLFARLLIVLLWLRYRVRITGLETIKKKGNSGILFLPNHPALIEPVILASYLYRPFRVRALADETQVNRFLIRTLARRINVLTIPDLSKKGVKSAEQVRRVIDQCVDALTNGDNLILYPAGRIYRKNFEQIGANSAVERIISALPDVRVVLVRTRGMWGSGFSWASGYRPLVMPVLRKGLKSILLNGIFFTPRRCVDIELVEPDDFPRKADRITINTYLDTFYNRTIEHNTYVPYTFWEHGGIKVLPEPETTSLRDDSASVSEIVRRQVISRLKDITGISDLKDEMSLVRDMGMDSLAIVELISWLEAEYGNANIEVDSLRTVGDVFLAASGAAVSIGEKISYKVPSAWFRSAPQPSRSDKLKDMTITEAFLYQAKRQPDKAAVADQMSEVMTYRDMVLAIMLLKKQFSRLPGDYLGIMLPASVAVSLVYLAALFAGKIPVMVNWTLGRRNLQHILSLLNVRSIITAEALVSRIEAAGVELDELKDRFVMLEDLRKRISRPEKLSAFLKAHLNWMGLTRINPPQTAVVLFTSGSESLPKAVPLTHRNILTNIWDSYECFTISNADSLMGILPPFHSFGLTVSVLLPLCLGARVVFYPNPTHGGPIAEIIKAYKLTILLGTPTFLKGILRVSSTEQLRSLRLVVTGAEKCPQSVYDMLAEVCPGTKVLEGYGVTECSPIISVNHEENPVNGTIGKVMSSLEYAIVDVQSGERLPCTALVQGRQGLLLVRGDSVFSGYLNYDGASPFVELEGKKWYMTGDLVIEDYKGTLTFLGRLKRFVKLGGEMISLPAIESVLEQHFALYQSGTGRDDEGPILAVTVTPDEEKKDIVLFCTLEITRESANQVIRQSGLSGLHNIRMVKYIDKIPLLGTGKVDYQTLNSSLVACDS
jgi:acyl-CoA synthetase (AMP-forming)/AMP-acid ligase II/1-acyl-sn-glycerol-3-phosphate acyltransferase/acyl carrier protein